MLRFGLMVFALPAALVCAQPRPNLADNIEHPLRYRPDGADFVIENGAEFFNRPLYGGNTAFRVDGGDKPEFVLYLPGRGGNLRFGIRKADTVRWLHDAATIVTRYRPGSLYYELRDPMLGSGGIVRLAAIASHENEAFLVRAEAANVTDDLELVWAFGGVNGERGRRDGDIGTENVPISRWFQLAPEFCRDNTIELGAAGTFLLRARVATIAGATPDGAQLAITDAKLWNDPAALFAGATSSAPELPVAIGRVALAAGKPLFFSLRRSDAPATASDVPREFAAAEAHFAALRARVSVDTPDPFINAAVGALNVAADAVWDEPQQAIMHGAIAWRSKLLGWRGPYALDALGWHERARRHFRYWASRQNTREIPEQLPPADENANLARNETALHSNGDLSNSHYDMNLVYIDALFRHLMWTDDLELARELWPVIERHLAWEQRLFRREFGPRRLPLYEAYAAIWASDDLQYHGGGVMHASAYNYFHNQQAARLARRLKLDPSPYQREAQLLERGMREHLWVAAEPDRGTGGWFAEYKDLLGLQRVHPNAALWTFYHAMDSEVPTPQEAWHMTRQVETQIPHLPVRGAGVPEGLVTVATTNWMPYHWSINNVVMAEAVHGALGFWQAARPEEAWRIMKGSIVAAMFMGICPGNVGSMSYLDVYRRESQRDFADGSGVLSRALIEGLFGVKPDALAGELRVSPGWPAKWGHASLRHPAVGVTFLRAGETDTFVIEQRFAKPLALRLRLVARRDRIAAVTIDGQAAEWHVIENAIGKPQIAILAEPAARREVVVRWAGEEIRPQTGVREFARVRQGEMRWWHAEASAEPFTAGKTGRQDAGGTGLRVTGTRFELIDLSAVFNDRVTQIFKQEYRAPRSPYVSLALPKQGIGGWAGGVNATAEIDDAGLRAAAGQGGGLIVLPNGVPFATPAAAGAKNVAFTSWWDNYPNETSVPLSGRARQVFLLLAGSTNHMQAHIDNGEVIVGYADGTRERLALVNPANWWPIEQDLFIDDFQFRVAAASLPTRVDLKTGRVRVLEMDTFKGRGRRIRGGAANVLALTLDPEKELKTLTVRTLSNEIVIGLMAATLVR